MNLNKINNQNYKSEKLNRYLLIESKEKNKNPRFITPQDKEKEVVDIVKNSTGEIKKEPSKLKKIISKFLSKFKSTSG